MASFLQFEKENEEKYKYLTSKNRNGIFLTYKSVYITATLIAYKLELDPCPIATKHSFIRDTDLSEIELKVLQYIAFSKTKNTQTLEDSHEIINMTNGLANAGIDELYKILTRGGNGLIAILNYCSDNFWNSN